MSLSQIDVIFQSLKGTFGRTRAPVSTHDLRVEFGKKNFPGMLRIIKSHMGLKELTLCMGTVRSGGPPEAPAWIKLPVTLPVFGSSEFRTLTLTVFFRKHFLEKASFEQVVCAMSHELSHVVLYAVRHPYMCEEKAVDLTAMFLGYREFYLKNETVEYKVPGFPPLELNFEAFENMLEFIFQEQVVTETRFSVGYLTAEEREYAVRLMAEDSATS
jgi:hypothetical protein